MANGKNNTNSNSYSNMLKNISNRQRNMKKSKVQLKKHMANASVKFAASQEKLGSTLRKKAEPLFKKLKNSLTPKLPSMSSLLQKSPLGRFAKTRRARRS
jgi:hypothetical protein